MSTGKFTRGLVGVFIGIAFLFISLLSKNPIPLALGFLFILAGSFWPFYENQLQKAIHPKKSGRTNPIPSIEDRGPKKTKEMSSSSYYPIQPDPAYPLELDNSYFLIKLFDAQAFFSGNQSSQVDCLVSSSVESTFNPGVTLQSLHEYKTLRKNIPTRLGININLTDWLPARATDEITITLNYNLVSGTIIQTLVDTIQQLDLASKVSAFRTDIAIAVKISQIVGTMLSSFLQEGEQVEVFPLTINLNLADLKAGYYAVVGSLTDEILSNTLQVDAKGRLTDREGHELSRYFYAVIQVLALKRRGFESLRYETWGELLQSSKDQALSAASHNDDERRKALQEWRTNLEQVCKLAANDRAFLEIEIDEIIADAQLEVEKKLLPMAELISEELRLKVRAYQDELELSKQQIQQYNLSNNGART